MRERFSLGKGHRAAVVHTEARRTRRVEGKVFARRWAEGDGGFTRRHGGVGGSQIALERLD